MTKMKHARVISYKPHHLDYLIENIRDQDREEIEASSGVPYQATLKRIEKYCENIWVAKVDDDIIALFGIECSSEITKTGIPWFISTKDILKHKIIFIKHCKEVFEIISENYLNLVNYVDERNDLAKSWLKWLGFTLEPPKPFGARQMPFHKFTMKKEVSYV